MQVGPLRDKVECGRIDQTQQSEYEAEDKQDPAGRAELEREPEKYHLGTVEKPATGILGLGVLILVSGQDFVGVRRVLVEEAAKIPDIQACGVFAQEVLGLGYILLRLLLHGYGVPPVP